MSNQLRSRRSSAGAFGMSAGCSISGIHISIRCPTMSPANQRGATPMMVSGTPFSVTERPTIDRSPANRFAQYA